MKADDAPKTYQQGKIYVFYLGLFLDLAYLILLQASGASGYIRTLAAQFFTPAWQINLTYFIVVLFGFYLIHLPLSVFLGYVWEHQFELSTQKFRQWFREDLKKNLLGFLVIMVLLQGIYWLLARFPQTWWLGAALFWLFISLVLARITPAVIVPLFYKYSRIDNEELRRRILELFKTTGIPVHDVYAINFSAKTKKANAFICGLGSKRRVVLSDTLIANFSVPEIETVVAHELGHYKHRDNVKFIIINTCTTLAAFWLADKFLKSTLTFWGLAGIEDVAFFPMLALSMMVLGIVTTPLLNAYSRMIEVAADRFSLSLTNKPQDFITMIKKLGDMNLADLTPSRLTEIMFYDHPPIAQRIKLAEGFRPA